MSLQNLQTLLDYLSTTKNESAAYPANQPHCPIQPFNTSTILRAHCYRAGSPAFFLPPSDPRDAQAADLDAWLDGSAKDTSSSWMKWDQLYVQPHPPARIADTEAYHAATQLEHDLFQLAPDIPRTPPSSFIADSPTLISPLLEPLFDIPTVSSYPLSPDPEPEVLPPITPPYTSSSSAGSSAPSAPSQPLPQDSVADIVKGRSRSKPEQITYSKVTKARAPTGLSAERSSRRKKLGPSFKPDVVESASLEPQTEQAAQRTEPTSPKDTLRTLEASTEASRDIIAESFTAHSNDLIVVKDTAADQDDRASEQIPAALATSFKRKRALVSEDESKYEDEGADDSDGDDEWNPKRKTRRVRLRHASQPSSSASNEDLTCMRRDPLSGYEVCGKQFGRQPDLERHEEENHRFREALAVYPYEAKAPSLSLGQAISIISYTISILSKTGSKEEKAEVRLAEQSLHPKGSDQQAIDAIELDSLPLFKAAVEKNAQESLGRHRCECGAPFSRRTSLDRHRSKKHSLKTKKSRK